jgi:hypothetical protein
MGGSASSRSARKGRPRCPCRTPSVPNRPVPLRAPTGREGRRPRRPQKYWAQRTVPLPGNAKSKAPQAHLPAWEGRRPRGLQGKADTGACAEPAARLKRPVPLRAPTGRGGTASPPSATIPGTGDCAPPARSQGRDRVLTVRKEKQTLGPAPNLQHDSNGQCLCELRLGPEGRHRRGLQEHRAQRTVPLPGNAKSKAPQPIREVGRVRVPAVWENAGRRGLRPSRTSCNRGHPSTLASPGGTASSGSARKRRPRCPCRTCSATQTAGALASSDRSGETASSRSAQMRL